MVLDGLVKFWLLGMLATLGAWEFRAARRTPTEGRGLRWPTNLTIWSLNALLVTVPIAPVALAVAGAGRGWGLLNQADASLPLAVAIAIAVVALDGLGYLQHRVLHASPILWRVHRVHHADVDLDATTGLRFHPIEALVSHATLVVGIIILGLPPLGVAVYLGLAAGNTILTHANIRFPSAIESRAGWLVVTPALHAVHHSALPAESERNFATIFSVWDRLGSTYGAQPTGRHENLRAGLEEFREPRYLTLPWTLAAAPPSVLTG
ncbi:MAG: sterol desaturase family protein [Actinobacteria bacterium]|nr:MAG: sterol desaturase family protein [Actinomycetota bacterium]